MRAILFHVSTLIGLLVFLNQLWTTAEIDRVIFTAFTTGLGIYVVLLFGYAGVHRLLAYMKEQTKQEGGPDLKGARPPAESTTDEQETPQAEHDHAVPA